MKDLEIERISEYVADERPKTEYVRIEFDCECFVDTIVRIKSVLLVSIAASKERKWPEEDDWWIESLPDWFVKSFDHSVDELMANESLWHFGSWTDALHFRGWQWWSCDCRDNIGAINVMIDEVPFVLGPFIYLIGASGGGNVRSKDVFCEEGSTWVYWN